ncbi:DNA polymerase III subunit delta [Thalassobaculum fulvum]|uniref:DNA-directed DNA polymerase n=1 Tax=Thalassobaculum fulvum TaxID=1633335 RepID=A0A918XNM8_9PROT|nr:DNA polymerase III subunit delta [Thalassobaculum fulvum]GHD39653.1 DNA polymerase III subunit delta [Thalassobaculum fulvum]
MKVQPRELDGFVKRPPAGLRGVLVYGPDGGKVRETAERLGRTVVADLADPFNVTVLSGEEAEADPARLADEAAARSLMGGRRLVRLRDARDRTADALGNAFDGPETDTLIVVEAGELKAGTGLRKLFEDKRTDLAAIACYADEARDVSRVIRETLEAAGVRIAPDAVQLLSERLGNDRMATRTEIDKLALLVGPGGTIDLETAMEAVGDSAALEIDALVSAAAEGRPDGIVPGLDRAFRQGESPIRVLRQAQGYFQRLHLAASRAAEGRSPADAVKSLRPPVFFKAVEPMTRQVARWNPSALAAALARLGEAEIRCKTTGFPDQAECGQALIDVARMALRAARRSR